MLATSAALSHRANNFDALRFILAAAVIFSHSFDLRVGSHDGNPVYRLTGGQADPGSLAVSMFFILSGYLITQSFLASRPGLRGVSDFFLKRALRIYPAYIVCCLACLVFFAPLGRHFLGYFGGPDSYWAAIEWPKFIFRVLSLQTLWLPQTFTSNAWPYVNAAIWTIHYEALCYILAAALGIAGLLRRRYVVLALFLFAWGFHLYHHYSQTWLYGWGWQEFPLIGGTPDAYPRFAVSFLAGAAAYLFRDRLPLNAYGAMGAAALAAGALLFTTRAEVVLAPTLASLVLWFGQERRVRLHNFGRRGDFSYGLYVYGWPVQQSLIMLLGRELHPLALFVISLAAAFVLAFASWHLVERPFLQLKPRRRAAETVAASIATEQVCAAAPTASPRSTAQPTEP